jgi:serine/threonine protein kinase
MLPPLKLTSFSINLIKLFNGGNVMGCFGITKDTSSNYLFVTKYYEDGDYLYSRINEAYETLGWKEIIEMLWGISGSIENVHESGSFYENLHGGNLLVRDGSICIVDAELQCLIDSKICGVLPYIAPEILRGNSLTKASDIYSFGIIMWVLSAGIRPWCDRPHDSKLVGNICSGLRPRIIDGTPNVYIQLIKRCWNSDPSKCPTASQSYELTGSWCDHLELSDQFEQKTFSDSEKNKFHQQEIHPRAFYTSRLLYFP